MAADICFSVAVLGKVQMMQSPYAGSSPASWYNREESHSGQLYHLWKVALSFCPEYDTSLTNYNIKYGNMQELNLNGNEKFSGQFVEKEPGKS